MTEQPGDAIVTLALEGVLDQLQRLGAGKRLLAVAISILAGHVGNPYRQRRPRCLLRSAVSIEEISFAGCVQRAGTDDVAAGSLEVDAARQLAAWCGLGEAATYNVLAAAAGFHKPCVRL